MTDKITKCPMCDSPVRVCGAPDFPGDKTATTQYYEPAWHQSALDALEVIYRRHCPPNGLEVGRLAVLDCIRMIMEMEEGKR